MGKKKFNIQYGIGKAKYVISYHNGRKKHSDGSNFYDIKIFKSKVSLERFKKNLLKRGYVKI